MISESDGDGGIMTGRGGGNRRECRGCGVSEETSRESGLLDKASWITLIDPSKNELTERLCLATVGSH
jgi:hypothetical protein